MNQEIGNLDLLYFAGASSGGARPKIFANADRKEWIIKFPSPHDPPDIGMVEKCYSDCAMACGIPVPGTRLFPSKKCRGYFGAERFDRGDGGRKIHMLTVAALLELDFTEPSLDYNSLMKLCKILTRDDEKEKKTMFRLMCFNVFAHNRDDHSKNFSYLYDEKTDRWHLSPAYDLTYSSTYFGEQTTSVNGEGKNPGLKDVLAVGKNAGLPQKFCRDTANEIKERADKLIQKVQTFL